MSFFEVNLLRKDGGNFGLGENKIKEKTKDRTYGQSRGEGRTVRYTVHDHLLR